ncbi:hypothetical protein QUB70_29430 [Microcoleus sp. A003_D6]|uniref:hypothetical protein n=1 Tax=Microcoleus sp. A003_D6 TaxID=3055266 RepID=UPI002FD79374
MLFLALCGFRQGRSHNCHGWQPPAPTAGDTDRAIDRFRSTIEYKVAPISSEPVTVGEPLLAVGFPASAEVLAVALLAVGFPASAEVLAVAPAFLELLLSKSLPQGYGLGYTNEVKIFMSGGPIFNAKGFLVGINGRGKYREPDFGVYAFEDGSEPTPELLEKVLKSSWGIPISIYLQFVSSDLGVSDEFVGFAV